MAIEIRKIQESEVFTGKSLLQPVVDAAAANPGQWLEFTHKSANMVGRLRKYGLEAQGQRSEDKTYSIIQYRLPEGATLQTPPKQVRKAKDPNAPKKGKGKSGK